jgi:glycosyltransferase involved in cell wall biosynthesis
MPSMPTFTIVTPSHNRLRFFRETITSVVTQRGGFRLQYVVADGGSGPSVIDFLKEQENLIPRITEAHGLDPVAFRWFSGPDRGMYDAITRGFALGDGEIMAWINSDDFYLPGAFQAVAEIFQTFPNIDWISGIPAICNATNTVVHIRDVFSHYNQRSIALGYHHRRNKRFGYDWIQQDCVFWRRRLWLAAGGFGPDPGRFAGDYFLWQRFARHAPLVKVQAVLSAFRKHGDQITGVPAAYEAEIPTPPRPSVGLLLHNHSLNLARVYPSLSRFPAGLKRLLRCSCRSAFGIDAAFFPATVINWCAEDGHWIRQDYP